MGGTLVGWLQRTLGGSGGKHKSAGDVIEAYGALLENYPLAIRDVSTLPLSKTQNEGSAESTLCETDRSGPQNHIEIGFMMLSKFQDGVGSKPIDGTFKLAGKLPVDGMLDPNATSFPGGRLLSTVCA